MELKLEDKFGIITTNSNINTINLLENTIQDFLLVDINIYQSSILHQLSYLDTINSEKLNKIKYIISTYLINQRNIIRKDIKSNKDDNIILEKLITFLKIVLPKIEYIDLLFNYNFSNELNNIIILDSIILIFIETIILKFDNLIKFNIEVFLTIISNYNSDIYNILIDKISQILITNNIIISIPCQIPIQILNIKNLNDNICYFIKIVEYYHFIKIMHYDNLCNIVFNYLVKIILENYCEDIEFIFTNFGKRINSLLKLSKDCNNYIKKIYNLLIT